MAEAKTISIPTTPAPAKVPVHIANKDRVRKLPVGALNNPNYKSTTAWVVLLPEGYTVADALQPSFWANVARQFEPKFHHFIDILNDERTLFARLYVRAVQENQLIVAQIGETQRFGPVNVDHLGKLKPKWNVGKRGWDVVRASDGMVVQDGTKFGVQEQAQAWIDDHLKKLAA